MYRGEWYEVLLGYVVYYITFSLVMRFLLLRRHTNYKKRIKGMLYP